MREASKERLNSLTRIVVLGACYFVGALVGRSAQFGSGKFELVWPPFGIGLAALLVFKQKRYCFGIVLGSLFHALLSGMPLGTLTLSVVVGNVAGVLIGVFLLERFVHSLNPMLRIQDVAVFAGLACALGSACTAMFQAVAEAYSEAVEWSALFTATLRWWVPNGMAGLVVAPFLVSWAAPDAEQWSGKRALEAVLGTVGLAVATWVSFESWFGYGIENYPMAFLPYPFLVWASVRFGMRGATAGTLLVSALAIRALLQGHGPFVLPSERESALLIGSYLAVLAVTNMMLAAAVTERRLAEEALRRSQEMFFLITNNVTDLIAVTDTGGKRLYNSASYWRILGDPGRLRGTDAFKEIHPQDREKVKRVFEESVRTKAGQRTEFRFLLQDGQVRYIESLGNYVQGDPDEPGRILTVARDITERKQTEEQLRKLSRGVEHSPVTIIITDTEGTIEYVNPRFTQMTGYPRGEVIGKNPRLLKSGCCSAADYKSLWDTIKAGREWRGELRNKKANGDLFWVSATISPILGDDGQITHFLAVEEDVTDRKNAEEARDRLEAQLRQAQKMEAIGTLAGGIAHDFNNILGSVIGYTELVLRAVEKGGPANTEHLEAVLQASNSAKDLIRQILTFSRQGKPERKPIKLQPVVKEVLKLLRSTLPTTIEIVADIRENAPAVLADPIRVHQVLMNLCANGAYAMRGQLGKLEVNLARVVVDEQAAHCSPDLRVGPYVRLSVRDTGRGMTPEVMKRIFEPFFTTKGPGEGTGLGLSVVRGIVREHEGAVCVSSQPGEGTVFTVFLPVYEAEAPLEETLRIAAPSGHGERILFVDDEQMLCMMGQMMLENLGYRATTCSDPLAALELFGAHPQEFDLVISDLTMPKMTGVDLALHIRKLAPNVCLMLMTGYSSSFTTQHVQNLGICDILQKPFTHESLGDAVHKALLAGRGKTG